LRYIGRQDDDNAVAADDDGRCSLLEDSFDRRRGFGDDRRRSQGSKVAGR